MFRKISPTMQSGLGFDWGAVQSGLNDVASIWNAYNPQPYTVPKPVPQPVLGGSTGTLLVIGGALILTYALISRKR